ncbi:hypothetical protein [Motiliproteus sediminis]|uniref:hypothetical protein n=1 Tax=Motiliproteus sediminis TaxID=1468178 RepID=UPI001AF00D2F|nr:hypothetical protein [Motiliproteus sediminis]
MSPKLEQVAIDTTALTRIAGQRGSNPGGIYEDASGQRYYVKTLESPQLARNERIAARLYQLAGAPTLDYVDTLAADQVATRWLDLDKTCVAHLSDDEILQAQRWFGVHAWTANWDVAGFNGDNQGVANGRVITLDLGGALSFRAQGDPKGPAFGTEVHELERLRSDPDNPHARRLFAGMDEAALGAAIQRVVVLTDQAVCAAVLAAGGSQKLADKLVARKAFMAARL